MPISVRQLEAFRAVAETKSFTRASQKLFISQSTVSDHVRELETIINNRLFVRNKRSVDLTQAGKRLLEQTQKIFRLLKEAEEDARATQDPFSGRLSIGCASSLMVNLLPPILVEYSTKFPEVELNIHSGTTQEIVTNILTGNIDLALEVLPITNPVLRKIVLFEESFVAVLPISHPLARHAKLKLRDLKNEPLILYRQDTNTRKILDRYFFRRKFAARVVMEVDQSEAIKEMVAYGFGVSVLPESVFKKNERSKELKTFPIAGKELKRSLAIICLRSKPMRPPAEALLSLLQAQFSHS